MILDRIHRKHFPATRPLGTDGSRAADQRPAPPGGVFHRLLGFFRLPTIAECRRDLLSSECWRCGNDWTQCPCEDIGGEG